MQVLSLHDRTLKKDRYLIQAWFLFWESIRRHHLSIYAPTLGGGDTLPKFLNNLGCFQRVHLKSHSPFGASYDAVSRKTDQALFAV